MKSKSKSEIDANRVEFAKIAKDFAKDIAEGASVVEDITKCNCEATNGDTGLNEKALNQCQFCHRYYSGFWHTCPSLPPAYYPPVATGWICPKCGRTYAPFVSSCPY